MTSIDLPTQLVAEQGLIGRRGAVVAIDPNNGDVIALVSTPGFDPNPFGRGLTTAEYARLRDNIDKPLLNRALRGEYPPGSTVKPAIALAGLATGVTTPQHTKCCPGYFRLPGSSHRFRDWRPAGHGTVAMETAIAQSCDVYFYELASMLGVEKLSGFLAHFGLGQVTGIDIGGERKRHPADARVEEGALQESGRPGVVSRRDRDLRHRPGLPDRHAAAGRAHGVDPRLARQELSAAPGHGVSRTGHGQDQAHHAQTTRNHRRRNARAMADRDQRHDQGHELAAARAGAARWARNTRSPARPAPRRCSPSRRTKATTRRRSSTSACSITAGSSRSRPRTTRRSRWR